MAHVGKGRERSVCEAEKKPRNGKKRERKPTKAKWEVLLEFLGNLAPQEIIKKRNRECGLAVVWTINHALAN